MATKARLETQITGDAAPFIAAANSVERRAQTLSARITGLFKRDPTQRAERALTGFIGDLSSGNVAGAIGNLTGRMSGFGLATGVAIGAGIALFERFKTQIDATSAAERKLAIELATLGGVRGPEQASAKLEALRTQTEDLIQKSRSGGTRFGNFLDDVVNPALGTSSKGKGAAQAHEIRSGLAAQAKLMSDRATAEERVVALKDKGLNVSERQAALDKIAYDASVKRSAIDEEATRFKLNLFKPELKGKIPTDERNKLILGSEATSARRKDAVTADERLATAEAAKRFDLKRAELALEERINAVNSGNLAPEEKRLGVLKERIGLLQKQITAEDEPLKKQALTNQLGVLRNEGNDALFNLSDQSPEGVAARNAGNLAVLKREAFNTNLAQARNPDRDAYGAVISGIGTIGPQSSSAERKTAETEGSGSSAVVEAIHGLESKMDEYWGGGGE